jgi:hypothetical protein
LSSAPIAEAGFAVNIGILIATAGVLLSAMETYIKAVGNGLYHALDRFDVTLIMQWKEQNAM